MLPLGRNVLPRQSKQDGQNSFESATSSSCHRDRRLSPSQASKQALLPLASQDWLLCFAYRSLYQHPSPSHNGTRIPQVTRTPLFLLLGGKKPATRGFEEPSLFLPGAFFPVPLLSSLPFPPPFPPKHYLIAAAGSGSFSLHRKQSYSSTTSCRGRRGEGSSKTLSFLLFFFAVAE